MILQKLLGHSQWKSIVRWRNLVTNVIESQLLRRIWWIFYTLTTTELCRGEFSDDEEKSFSINLQRDLMNHFHADGVCCGWFFPSFNKSNQLNKTKNYFDTFLYIFLRMFSDNIFIKYLECDTEGTGRMKRDVDWNSQHIYGIIFYFSFFRNKLSFITCLATSSSSHFTLIIACPPLALKFRYGIFIAPLFCHTICAYTLKVDEILMIYE